MRAPGLSSDIDPCEPRRVALRPDFLKQEASIVFPLFPSLPQILQIGLDYE
jgi:hypothetical protein